MHVVGEPLWSTTHLLTQFNSSLFLCRTVSGFEVEIFELSDESFLVIM